MTFVVLHYHLRPGGVRRVIEMAVPHLIAHWPERIERVVLVTGEAPEARWLGQWRKKLRGPQIEVRVEPAFGYASEQTRCGSDLRRAVSAGVRRLVREAERSGALVWAHNLGLGRNVHLSRELTAGCNRAGIPLVAHHHDWWFENRWHHFKDMQRAGFRTLGAVARAVFETGPATRHVAINQADAGVLGRHFPGQSAWLPNLLEPEPAPGPARHRFARAWLRQQIGDDAPVWLMPCRLLRRKNLLEAFLLTRWLAPDAWLVTTGGVSSEEERAYGRAVCRAARARRWRLRLGVLAGAPAGRPTVAELLAVSDAVLLTSLQEGFGLPYLEASAAGRPLIARRLPNVAPDLAMFGFEFPQSYDELLVDPGLFNWRAERQRQRQRFEAWRAAMPAAAARFVECPALLRAGRADEPVPFARLTWTAQMEVLAQPVEQSWKRCLPLNRFLADWRERAERGRLEVSPWPSAARPWLSGAAYAARFLSVVEAPGRGHRPRAAADAVQEDFLRQKLRAAHLYPLLWD